MFYRYEAKNESGQYEGIFKFFNPDQRRYFNRFVKEPKWYEKNPNTNSHCWFTDKGYEKYHSVVEKLISECHGLEVRLLKKESLENIVCKGKIQCIEKGW